MQRKSAAVIFGCAFLASSAAAFTPLTGPRATTFRINSAHTGTTAFDPPLTLPLTRIWQKSFQGPVSYPLIADGRAFVAYSGPVGFDYGEHIVALDEATGQTLWGPVDIAGTYYFAGIAYEGGRIFAVDFDGLLQAFDATDGSLSWSVQLPGQYAFTAAPTTSHGMVFVGGAGVGGTVYALAAANGALLWTGSVENGDGSSPAVSGSDVFVAYSCPQVYSFDFLAGTPEWHYSGPCEGGGGRTVVARDHRLYVRDEVSNPAGYVFDSDSGALLDRFDAEFIPAIGTTTGYFLHAGTLRGVDLASSDVLWSFAGDGQLGSAPIVVNGVVLIGSQSGVLYALDAATGHAEWSENVGSPISPEYEGGASMLPGLAAGDGVVLVPAGDELVAYAPVQHDAIFANGFDPD